MTVQITHATAADVPGMMEVFYRAWLDVYPNDEFGITVEDIEHRFADRHTSEGITKRAERIINPPPGETMLIAKIDYEVIGLIRLISIGRRNEIQALYVLPKYHRKGIGSMLVSRGMKFLNPSLPITVWAATYNKKALPFYRKLGFRETGKVAKDAQLVMRNGNMMPEMELVRPAESPPLGRSP